MDQRWPRGLESPRHVTPTAARHPRQPRHRCRQRSSSPPRVPDGWRRAGRRDHRLHAERERGRPATGRSPGARSPAYRFPSTATPSSFEKPVVRTLSNPRGEPRTQHARTPHHLLNGTFTPNGLHFVISHSGAPDIDPAQHRLVIHGLVRRPLVVHARHARPLSDGVADDVCRVRRQQRAAVLE